MTRTARTSDLMWLRLFQRFEGRSPTLQGQLRDMLVHGVLEGFLPAGAALPSSRLLAATLGAVAHHGDLGAGRAGGPGLAGRAPAQRLFRQ